MEKIHCPTCNELLPSSSLFCAYCGQLLTPSEEATIAGGPTVPIREVDNDAPTIVYADIPVRSSESDETPTNAESSITTLDEEAPTFANTERHTPAPVNEEDPTLVSEE